MGLVRGFDQAGTRAAINEQLHHRRQVELRTPSRKQKKKEGKRGRRRPKVGKKDDVEFNLERPSSLMYDGTVAGEAGSLNTGVHTGGEGVPPQTPEEWRQMVNKEREVALNRLSTPVWKRRPTPKHSLTELLGRGPNVFMSNIASRQSMLSPAGSLSDGLGSKLGSPKSAASSPATGKMSPSISSGNQLQQNSHQFNPLEKPSVSSKVRRRIVA
jgi:hypothetical protein